MLANISFQGKPRWIQIKAPAIAHPEKVRTTISGTNGVVTNIECNVTLGPKVVDRHNFQNKKGITDAELDEVHMQLM